MILIRCLALSLVTLFSTAAFAGMEIRDAWYRIPPPGSKVTAAYFTVVNTGDKADKLVSATSTLAETLEFHDMKMGPDGHQMFQIPGIEVAAKSQVELKPGGKHMMLINVDAKADHKSPAAVNFKFATAGVIEAKVAPKEKQ